MDAQGACHRPLAPRRVEFGVSESSVVWIFSLARSGSSVTAYAAAAPWGHAVADEPFGPWDRSGPPYNYPAEQPQLKSDFFHAGEHLTPPVVDLARRLFARIAGPTGRLVVKHPHRMIDPAEFRVAFPDHRAVHLLRNPLHRLNSMYARRQLGAIGPGFDLEVYKEIARRWLDHPHRVLYDALKADPAGYFRAIYEAWGWSYTPDHIAAAVAYQQRSYHEASARVAPARDPRRVLSEHRRALPPEAVRAYLDDPFIADLMDRNGWSRDPADYLPPQHASR